jgi:menaquinone-specific isochorismate synthase
VRDLEVPAEPHTLELSNVTHLATDLAATLHDGSDVLDLVAALHPTAAVGGAPRDLALARIRALEGMDRGRYSGPVGWVDADGDGEFGIALRCAALTPTGARLFAGAGIVGSSLPEAELEETRIKLRAMRSALEDS